MLSFSEQACDCHVHVIGDRARYPMLPARPYTPPVADISALRRHLDRLALGRAVVIQPSVYGTDNQCLIDTLQAMPDSLRGVAVLDPDVRDAELEQLAAAGVTGIRINLESTGGKDPGQALQIVEHWAGKLAGSGWHIQLYAHHEVVEQVLQRLSSPSLPLVIDHFAMLPPQMPQEALKKTRLYAMLAQGALYIKLSAAYRIGDPVQARQIVALAHALLQANPERMLWASDWPHTNREPGKAPDAISQYRAIDPRALIQEQLSWLFTDALRRKVLVDNPARLYRFAA